MEQEITCHPMETWTDLNDTLMSLPIFSCKKCQQFLIPPIRFVAGTGRICGACTLPESQVAIHDSALEVILQTLSIPCPNSSKGCKAKLEYFSVSSHMSTCSNRNYRCPFRFVTDCMWEGGVSHISKHASMQHLDDVIRVDSGVFPLQVDISISNDTIKILQMESEQFIVHTKCNVSKSKLYYFLYYIGNIEKAQEFSYSIEQTANTGGDNCSLQHNSKYKILQDVNFKMDGDEDNALVVDLSLVKQLSRGPMVGTVLTIISKNNKCEELDEKLLSFFECPVCNNFMRPPIFQCLSGHSLCNRCRPKLGQCPSCRTGFGNTRNYALESMSNGIKFPCTYRDLGCNVVLSASDVNKHELECKVRPYNCPFMEINRCSWDGTYLGIITHLREQHADKCKFSNYAKVCAGFTYENNFADVYCMVVNGDIFRVCHKRDMGNHNTYWAVQYVGPRNEAKNYKCEIGLLDIRNDNRKLIRFDLCQDLTNFDSMFNQCIMLPSNVVSWFSNNGQVTYYCKINKISNTN
ncbi:uncharacterized protein LOC116167266 [Photinus pyralis]|uniref:E3 ubiquitin-protein ligase n=1 Tax=Photinus pyralis TaxID=7054 RepID=A0A1Y1KJZ6_PHOPY|nr:uncharacterized protein LOC116167266 [Photinus pyralis]